MASSSFGATKAAELQQSAHARGLRPSSTSTLEKVELLAEDVGGPRGGTPSTSTSLQGLRQRGRGRISKAQRDLAALAARNPGWLAAQLSAIANSLAMGK